MFDATGHRQRESSGLYKLDMKAASKAKPAWLTATRRQSVREAKLVCVIKQDPPEEDMTKTC